MSMLNYIAASDPQGAMNVINNFGYNVGGVNSTEDLADMLYELVNQEGEEAVVALAKIHPDREVIVEANVPQDNGNGKNGKSQESFCGCKSCRKYVNKAGLGDLFGGNAATLLIISGTILLTAAIIYKS